MKYNGSWRFVAPTKDEGSKTLAFQVFHGANSTSFNYNLGCNLFGHLSCALKSLISIISGVYPAKKMSRSQCNRPPSPKHCWKKMKLFWRQDRMWLKRKKGLYKLMREFCWNRTWLLENRDSWNKTWISSVSSVLGGKQFLKRGYRRTFDDVIVYIFAH